MALPGAWTRLEAAVIGVALGTALADAMKPVFEVIRQQAWHDRPSMVVDPGTGAQLVAEQIPDLGFNPADDARRNGLGARRFAALTQLAREYPGLTETLQLWRRGVASDTNVEGWLHRHGFSGSITKELLALKDERLDPAVIALAIVRGIMKDPGILPVGPPTGTGKVPAFPVSPLDTLKEAESAGINLQRLFVETAVAGRPMGPEAAASAVHRGIIEKVDFDRAIAEGDVRNEWADAIFAMSHQIPSVADFVNAHLRGWIDEKAMYRGTARHGMSEKDTHLLFLRTGRPAAPGQMATAAARGIDGPANRPMDRDQFLKGIAESDIRPEWGPMLWDARFLYPPLFQLTRLVQAGAIDADTAKNWAKKDRYPDEVTNALHAYWTQAPATANPFAGRADTQLWTTLHRSYVAMEADEETARGFLADLGIDGAAQDHVIGRWDRERALVRAQLTPAQIKKAYQKVVTNPQTGVAWTRDDAIAALISRGYTLGDAATFIDT